MSETSSENQDENKEECCCGQAEEQETETETEEMKASEDSETEELIKHAIARMMYGRTSVVIAHRLSTIQHADSILVVDKGEIKEAGNHENLLALGGYYAQLYHMQYKEVG